MDITERFDAGRAGDLVERTRSLKEAGYRLVQIGCLKAAAAPSSPGGAGPAAGAAAPGGASPEKAAGSAPTNEAGAPPPAAEPAGAAAGTPGVALEIVYSFDKAYELIHLRLGVREGETVPSVSDVYGMAFLYENEIHDLFGVSFEGLALDFHGTFYQKRSAAPFVAVDGQGR